MGTNSTELALCLAERSARIRHRRTYVDLTRYFCNDRTCPEIIGDTVVFRDHHHLTQTFSRQLSQPLWQQLEPLTR